MCNCRLRTTAVSSPSSWIASQILWYSPSSSKSFLFRWEHILVVSSSISVFMEIILCPQLVLLPFRKGLEILIPSRTEIDVPSPETAYQWLRICLILLPHWAVGAFGALGLIISISLLPSFVLLHRKQIDKVSQCRQAEGGWQCPFPTGALEADNYAIHSEHERNECYRCKNDS